MPIWRFGFGPYTLDLAAGQLSKDGQPLAITPRDLAVLRCLVLRSGQVVSIDEILEAVWPDTFVVRGVVKAVLHRIRTVLGDSVSAGRYIETVGRHGYRFTAEVQAEAASGTSGLSTNGEREPQLARLDGLLAKARAGERQIVFAGDESPAPLAALVEEFLARAERRAVLCARGDCLLQPASAEPHRPVLEALRRLCRGPFAEEVLAVLQRRAPRWLERVRGNVSREPPAADAQELVDALDALASILPLILVIEDFHHADRATLELLPRLAAQREGARLLVLVTFDAARRRDPAWPLASVVQLLVERGLAVELESAVRGEPPVLPRLRAEFMPFVGRIDELDLLGELLQRAQAGAGSIGLIVGEPGIGKTRLLEEFATRARAVGARVLGGRCERADLAEPFGPISQAIAAYARETSEPALRDDLGPYAGIVAKAVPALRERLEDLPSPPSLSPDEERRRLLDALVQMLWSIERRSPLVLIVDDLHWADASTLALLRLVSRLVGRHRLLVVGAYRDAEIGRDDPLAEAVAELRRDGGVDPIALTGLDEQGVAALLAGLGIGEVPEPFVSALREETAGNPLFCRELLLHLLEEGRIGAGVAPASWAQSVREVEVPEGVREVVSRRLARLPDEAIRLLAAASGCADSFRLDVAAAAADLDDKSALDGLDAALDAQLVRETGEPERYRFTHALVRSALYGDSSSSRRVRLHRRLATELERAYGESAPAHALEIAQQWHRSAALPGAAAGVRHCEAAAEQAARAAAYDEAAAALRMALDLIAPTDPRRPRLLARLGLALVWSLAFDDAVEVALQAAKAISEHEGDDAAADYLAEAADAVHASAFDPRAWVLAERGLHYAGARRDLTWARLVALDLARRDASQPDLPGIPLDGPDRVEASRLLVASAPALGERGVIFGTATTAFDSLEDVRARGMRSAPFVAFWAGDYRTAIEMWRESAGRHLERGQLAAAALLLSSITRCKLALGDASGLEHEFPKALELVERIGSPPFMVMQLGAPPLEYVMVRGEDYEPFIRGLGAAVANVSVENRWLSAMARSYGALFCAHAGRREEALRELAHVLPAIERAPGWAPNYTAIVCFAIEVVWVLGCADRANVLEANLRQKTLKPDFRYVHTDARLALARLCALTGRVSEARDWFDAARAVLDGQGALPLRAIADLDEARMELGLGSSCDPVRAEGLLSSARERFAVLGMSGWQRRAEQLALG